MKVSHHSTAMSQYETGTVALAAVYSGLQCPHGCFVAYVGARVIGSVWRERPDAHGRCAAGFSSGIEVIGGGDSGVVLETARCSQTQGCGGGSPGGNDCGESPGGNGANGANQLSNTPWALERRYGRSSVVEGRSSQEE